MHLKKIMKKILTGVCLLSLTHILIAQDSADKFEQIEKSSRLTYSNSYNSHLNFEGRDVFVPQYGINNTLTYQNKNGFRASLGADYWNEFSPRGIAQNTLGIGYEFAATNRLTGSFDYEHWFLNHPNDTIRNALTNYLSTEWQADFDFIAPHASAAYIFGTEHALYFEFGIKGLLEFDDIFRENQSDKISFAPDITLVTGTDVQFTTINTVFKTRRKTTATSKTNSNEIYGLLNTELTLPVTYAQPRWSVTAAYHYAIPHSLGASDIVSPSFGYFVVGFNWHFLLMKN